ncbi:MAG: hypothetical protein N2Z72_06150 [Bacteroidales bacterium]|nr:hypothetical protein [Bacteroidales bacterium]
MKIFSLFSFFTSLTFLIAQAEVGLYNHMDLGSRWLSKNFFNAFYQGQYLDSVLKQKTLKKMGTFNTIGAYAYSRVNALFPLKDSSSLYFLFSHQLGGSLQFNKNLFELIFIGNKSFEDSAFTLNSTAQYYMHLTSIGGGKIVRKGSFTLQTGGVLSFILNATSADFSRTKLSFSENIDTIFARIDGFIETTSSNATFKGMGLGMDISLTWDNASEQAGISIFNIGPALLFRQAKIHYFDSALHFYGFTYDDIKALANQEDSLPSSIDEILTVKHDTGFKVKILPFILHGYFQQYLFNGQLKVQMFYTPIPSFIPQISVSYSLKPVEWVSLGPIIRYGGFNNFTVGMTSQIVFKNKLRLNLSLPTLSQMFKTSYLGYAFSLGFQYIFN